MNLILSLTNFGFTQRGIFNIAKFLIEKGADLSLLNKALFSAVQVSVCLLGSFCSDLLNFSHISSFVAHVERFSQSCSFASPAWRKSI